MSAAVCSLPRQASLRADSSATSCSRLERQLSRLFPEFAFKLSRIIREDLPVEGLRAWKKDRRSRQSREYSPAQIDPWRLATQVAMDTGGKAENKDGIHV